MVWRSREELVLMDRSQAVEMDLWDPLLDAVLQGEENLVQLYISMGANLSTLCDQEGRGVLHWSAATPSGELLVPLLIAKGIGAAPMIVAFYFRWKMHETDWELEAKVIEQKVIHNHHLEGHQHTHLSPVVQYFKEGYYFIKETVYQHRWRLLGTAGAWFILDVAFYANSLFSGQVTTSLGVAKTPQGEALASLFLQLIALPGYICTIFFIEKIGIIRLQLMGFFATGVFCIIIGGAQPDLVNLPALYIILYGLTFFFQNFGANATTYIVPSLAYPTSQRSTCHGMSAAAGKLGAILGAETFLYIADCYCHGDVCGKNADKELVNRGLRVTFFVCGAIAWSGLGWTYVFLPEDVVQGEHTTSYEALESTKTEAENKQTNNETLAIEMKTLEVQTFCTCYFCPTVLLKVTTGGDCNFKFKTDQKLASQLNDVNDIPAGSCLTHFSRTASSRDLGMTFAKSEIHFSMEDCIVQLRSVCCGVRLSAAWFEVAPLGLRGGLKLRLWA
eukprot:gene1344-1466_t